MLPIRVLLIDAHPAFTDGLSALLSTAEDLHVVGAVTDPSAAVATVRRLRPDVVTVDLDLGLTDGVAVIRDIHDAAPHVVIAVLTGISNAQRALSAIWCGATAWASKEDNAPALLDVLRRSAAGESLFPPALLGQVLRTLAAGDDPGRFRRGRLATLTPREYDVLLCLVEGLDRKSSAHRLHLSVNTVRTHVQSVFSKLGAHNTLEAVAVALAEGVRAPLPVRGR